MKPVQQANLYLEDGAGNGDCYNACLASLLELPLWMVPPFHQMFGRPDRDDRIDEWLNSIGYERVFIDGHQLDQLPDFYIACGKTIRGGYHAVVYSAGSLAHDPHYSGAGLVAVSYTYFLRRIVSQQSERELALEDLLRSARNIAERRGEQTAWERFSARIGSVTPKVFRILRSDEDGSDQS